MQLHRSAQESLKQCVMQLLCDSGPLGEALFEAQVELPRDFAKPVEMQRQDELPRLRGNKPHETSR